MKVLYVCGPYRAPTLRGIVQNIRSAEAVALHYWLAGYAVICPHTNAALLDGAAPDSVWLNGDLELLRRSDVVVMMPGWERSEGAKEEFRLAKDLGKEVVFHWETT